MASNRITLSFHIKHVFHSPTRCGLGIKKVNHLRPIYPPNTAPEAEARGKLGVAVVTRLPYQLQGGRPK